VGPRHHRNNVFRAKGKKTVSNEQDENSSGPSLKDILATTGHCRRKPQKERDNTPARRVVTHICKIAPVDSEMTETLVRE